MREIVLLLKVFLTMGAAFSPALQLYWTRALDPYDLTYKYHIVTWKLGATMQAGKAPFRPR